MYARMLRGIVAGVATPCCATTTAMFGSAFSLYCLVRLCFLLMCYTLLMSTTYERNAHFQGSAQQVAYKILDLIPNSLHTYSRDDQKLVKEIIAQYAYDLAHHVASSLDRGIPIEDIPDLKEWPK